MRKHDKPLTPRQIATARDQDIDFSDIPELDDDFWRNAELVEPDRTEQVTLRVNRKDSSQIATDGPISTPNDVLVT